MLGFMQRNTFLRVGARGGGGVNLILVNGLSRESVKLAGDG